MKIPHPKQWNCCTLSERKDVLPHSPGVYAVMNRWNKIFYIGRSKDLHSRWASGHHRYPQAEQIPGALLAYLPLPANQVNSVEASLISHYSPPWNNTPVKEDDDGSEVFILLAAIVAALFIFAPQQQPSATRSPDGVVAVQQKTAPEGYRLVIRAQPTQDSESLGYIQPGSDVLVLGDVDAYGWVLVRSEENITGYVFSDYLE